MIKKTYDRWCILNAQYKPTSCILGLPGRGMTGFSIAYDYHQANLKNTLIIGVTPHDFEWYPMPNGANDQDAAIKGIPAAISAVEKVIAKIQDLWGFPDEKIAIVGFSAGAVMTLQTVAHLGRNFAAAISHGGAILNPNGLPKSNTNTPIFIQHNVNDSAFSWEERYLPMQSALRNQKYNVKFVERPDGGHCVSNDDMMLSNLLISERLGYGKGYAKQIFGSELLKAYKKVRIV